MVQHAVLWYAYKSKEPPCGVRKRLVVDELLPPRAHGTRPGHLKSYFASCNQHCSQIALLQECDNGAAAKDVLLRLGLPGLHPSIVGGASFTHGWWDRNFLQIHNGLWGAGLKYTAVTLVWAGINDLTSRGNTHRRRRGFEGVWGMVRHSHSADWCRRWALHRVLIWGHMRVTWQKMTNKHHIKGRGK